MNKPGVTPNEFCRLAGFPELWKEKDLQDYIACMLRSQGKNVELEVTLGSGGRADILVREFNSTQVIEVKPVLDRGNIYQALGQAICYSHFCKNPKIVVMGLAPSAPDAYSSAKTAEWYAAKCGYSVIFLNEQEEWIPQGSRRTTFNFNLNWLFRLFQGKTKDKYSYRSPQNPLIKKLLKIDNLSILIVGLLLCYLAANSMTRKESHEQNTYREQSKPSLPSGKRRDLPKMQKHKHNLQP